MGCAAASVRCRRDELLLPSEASLPICPLLELRSAVLFFTFVGASLLGLAGSATGFSSSKDSSSGLASIALRRLLESRHTQAGGWASRGVEI